MLPVRIDTQRARNPRLSIGVPQRAIGYDWIDRTGERERFLGAPFRNAGLGTEAKHLLIESGFEVIQLHAIMSTIFEASTRFAAALLKQGYRPAGRLRRFDVKGGIYRDLFIFELLRDEWLAAHANA